MKNTVIINAKGLVGKSQTRDIIAAIFHPKKLKYVTVHMHEFYNFRYDYELSITMKSKVKHTILKCEAHGGENGDSWFVSNTLN